MHTTKIFIFSLRVCKRSYKFCLLYKSFEYSFQLHTQVNQYRKMFKLSWFRCAKKLFLGHGFAPWKIVSSQNQMPRTRRVCALVQVSFFCKLLQPALLKSYWKRIKASIAGYFLYFFLIFFDTDPPIFCSTWPKCIISNLMQGSCFHLLPPI